MDNATLELHHIQLEFKNNRTHHFRHFIDQYFCYKKGYVNSSGKPKWNLIFWKEWVSEKVKKETLIEALQKGPHVYLESFLRLKLKVH